MRGFRVGVVHPTTPFGRRVRELLSARQLPVTELKLFDSDLGGEATLTRFDGEVVVTQPIDADLFPGLDVCFFAGDDRELLNRLAEEASERGVLAIVEGALGLDAPVAAPGLDVHAPDGARLIAVPRMASFLVGAVAKRVKDSLGLERAVASVFLPAGERGEDGSDELQKQVVNILSFNEIPTDVFHEQLAFNVKLAGRGAWVPALAETVSREASALAGGDGLVTASLFHTSVFHGYAASIWVELPKPRQQKAIVACFKEPPFTVATGRGAKDPSPVGIAESNLIHVGGIRRPNETETPGFWLYAVSDTTAYDAGFSAVELAKNLLS